jgi:hypothetical protein
LKEKIWNRAVNDFIKFGGYEAIKLLGLPKFTSTKAIALAAIGVDDLEYRYSGLFEKQESFLIERLNGLWDSRHKAWSPDFDYVIKGVDVSRCYPGTINSVFATEALWRRYQRTKESALANRIVDTANGLIGCLHLYENGDKCCFSYNPSVKYYVHNANLFIALLIARASELSSGFPYRPLIEHCLDHTISDFEKQGVLRYAGPPTPNNTVDNYHTGFVLRTLQSLVPYICNDALVTRCCNIIERGVYNYATSFVTEKGVFKHIKEKGPIQAHSLAEALLMHSQFSGQFPQAFSDTYKRGVRKAFDALWDKKNKYFISESWLIGNVPIRKNTAPMPRWAWAWMFSGLTSLRNPC